MITFRSQGAPTSPWVYVLPVAIIVALAIGAGVTAALAPTYAMAVPLLVAGGLAIRLFMRSMPVSSQSTRGSLQLQLAFGLLFVSLIRIAERDPTSSSLGIQAIYEFSLQGCAAALLALGMLAAQERYRASPAMAFWIALGVFAIISAFWAPQLPLAAMKGIQLIAVCVMAATIASKFETKTYAVRFLAWFTTFIILGAILFQGFTQGFNNLRTLTGENDGRYRLNLLMIHPIYLGGLAGAVAVLLLIHRSRRLDWLAIAFLAGITVMTAARGPLGILVLVFIFYAILRSRITIASYLGWAAGILFPVVIVTAGLFTIPGQSSSEGPSATLGNLERDITTLNGRIPLWKTILERANADGDQLLSPFIGHGYASFRHFGLEQFSYAGDAHNAAIQVFSELGLIGVLIWLLAIFACARQAWEYESGRRAQLIAILPILYIIGTQMVDASLADSRSFVLVILLFYAHAGRAPLGKTVHSPVDTYRPVSPAATRFPSYSTHAVR